MDIAKLIQQSAEEALRPYMSLSQSHDTAKILAQMNAYAQHLWGLGVYVRLDGIEHDRIKVSVMKPADYLVVSFKLNDQTEPT